MNDTEQFYDSKRLGQLSSPEKKEVTTVDNNETKKNSPDKVNFIQNKAQSSMSNCKIKFRSTHLFYIRNITMLIGP